MGMTMAKVKLAMRTKMISERCGGLDTVHPDINTYAASFVWVSLIPIAFIFLFGSGF